MEGHCSIGQSPQCAVVPMEEEEVSYLIRNFSRFYMLKYFTKLFHCNDFCCDIVVITEEKRNKGSEYLGKYVMIYCGVTNNLSSKI